MELLIGITNTFMSTNSFHNSQLTTIRAIKHPIPSELGSQASVGLSSTMVGDDMGNSGVVSFLFIFG